MKTKHRDDRPLAEREWKELLSELDALTPLEIADVFAALFTLYPSAQAAFVLKSMCEFDRREQAELIKAAREVSRKHVGVEQLREATAGVVMRAIESDRAAR